jgi:RNA polymerase-binding transcription factor DksA
MELVTKHDVTPDLRTMRQRVEGEIASILKDQYGQSVDPQIPIKYYLDFKSDRSLIQLREALERIEKGTYGHCALCSQPIPNHVLENSPVAVLCGSCRR